MEIGALVCLSFVGTVALVPLVKHLAWTFGAISRPDNVRRLHARPIPLWGGAAVYAGFTLAALIFLFIEPSLRSASLSLTAALIISAAILCFVGMIDDRHPLSASGKIPGQLLAILPIVFAGFSLDQISCFGWELNLGWFAAPCTVAWLLLGINATNLLDGSDGLASTAGIVMSLTLAAIAATQGHIEVVVLALAMAGGLAGFLLYNRPPAQIYLGDCGSTLIGLVVASLALRAARGSTESINLASVLLIMFVPLLDTTLAILRRLLKRTAVWSGDRGHLHHQLQDRGFTATQRMLFVGVLCTASGAAAFTAMFGQWQWPALLAMAAVTALLMQRQLIAHQEWTLLTARIAQFLRTATVPPPELVEPADEPLPILQMTATGSLGRAHRSPPVPELLEQERRAA